MGNMEIPLFHIKCMRSFLGINFTECGLFLSELTCFTEVFVVLTYRSVKYFQAF